jgi:excisionase family DNA binding protein
MMKLAPMSNSMAPIDARNNDPVDQLWSVRDAAAALKVTTKTVYRHIQDHNLRAVRVGPRLLRIPHSELVAFLREIANKKIG